MNQMKRILSLIGFLGCGALMSGCAGTHIYHQADYDMATKTEASFKAANLSQMLVAERAQVTATSEREQAVVKRRMLSRRDNNIMALIENSNAAIAATNLNSLINQRIDELLGSVNLREVTQAWGGIDHSQEQVDTAATQYHLDGYSLDSIPDLPKTSISTNIDELRDKMSNISTNEVLSNDLLGAFDNYIKNLKQLEKWQAKYEATILSDTNSEIGQLALELKDIDANKKQLDAEIGWRKKAFKEAKEAYEKATASNTNITALVYNLTNTLAKLDLDGAGKAITNLQNSDFGGVLGDIELAGKIAKLEQQKAAVLELINLLAVDKTDTNLVKQAAGNPALLFLAGFMPRFNQTIKRPPSVGNLLLKEKQSSTELEAANRQLSHANACHQLLEQKLNFMRQELEYLRSARKNSEGLMAGLNNTNISQLTLLAALVALAKSSPDDSQKGFNALLNYSLSWQVGRIGEELADYALIAEQHQAALDNSEIALMEWENLIGVPLSQLVALHGSGIKPETIANFCNAIMVTAAVAAK
jgi:hypothetical protein